jgi:hypothetical protein
MKGTHYNEFGEGIVVLLAVLVFMLTTPAAVSASLDVCSLDIQSICTIVAESNDDQCRPTGQSNRLPN